MSDYIQSLAADFGIPLLFVVTLLSCLAIPIPSSLLMLASGGFAATGDLSLAAVAAAALCGAVIGDNLGYWIARHMGDNLSDWLEAHPKRANLRSKSEAFMGKWGSSSVFFSCWLVAPLGPYMNYVSGLSQFSWYRFALWGMAGEVFWVSIYVGMGYVFADQISEVSDFLGNLSGLIVAFVAVIGLGYWLIRASKARDIQALENGTEDPTSHS